MKKALVVCLLLAGVALAAPPYTITPLNQNSPANNEEIDPGEGIGDLPPWAAGMIGWWCQMIQNGTIDWSNLPFNDQIGGAIRQLCSLRSATMATAYAKNTFVAGATNFYNEVNKRDTITAVANNFDPLIWRNGKELKQVADDISKDLGDLEKGELTPQEFFEKYNQKINNLKGQTMDLLSTSNPWDNPYPKDTAAYYRFFLITRSHGLTTLEKNHIKEQIRLAERVINNQFLLSQSGRVQQKITEDTSHLDNIKAVTGIDPTDPTKVDPKAPVPTLNSMAEQAISERMAIQVVVKALTEQMTQSATETAMVSEYLKTQVALQAMTNQQLAMLSQQLMEQRQNNLEAFKTQIERMARESYVLGLESRRIAHRTADMIRRIAAEPYQGNP